MKNINILLIGLMILTACSANTEEISETEVIESTIQYVDDETLFEGEEIITTEKENGEKQITYKVTTKKGEVVNKEIISETIIKEPVDGIITRGTKVKLADYLIETYFDCGDNTVVRLNDDFFAYGIRQSGVGLFGSYKPVASHTYEVTIDNEQPMNNQHPFFITINNNKLYFSDDDHTTIESMNNRNDNAYSCELE